jgi:predicted transposase YbfD/YdcC
VVAGSRSFAAIGQWAADAGADVLAGLGAARGPAEESTFRRAFAMISADVLDQVLCAWLWTRTVQVSGRLVIAVDGKAVRGAKNKDGKAPHLVAALAHGIGAVLGQVAVTAKSNEIPAVRELLNAFTDLAGAVITIDALCRRRHNASYEDPVVMPMPPSGAVSVVAAGRTAGGIITGTRGTLRGCPGAGSVRSWRRAGLSGRVLFP